MKSVETVTQEDAGTELVSMSTFNFSRPTEKIKTMETVTEVVGDEYAALMQSARTRSEYWGIFANIIQQSGDF